MKYRLIAGVIFAIIVLIATFCIQPMLNTDNQLINLAYVVSLFIIGAILGYISRRLDGK
ncbi:putative tellurium resistance membrane protein TerC [Staphylococcus hominis]